MRNPNSFFAPWEKKNMALFWVVTVLGLFFAFVVTIPIGVVAALMLAGYTMVWQGVEPPENMNRAMFMPGTWKNSLAEFFEASRLKWREVATPVVCLGFGAPREDRFHDIPGASWMPPLRLSAMWAAVGALALSALDYVVNPFLFTAWGGMDGFRLPWFVMVPISAVGWFAVIQYIVDIKRWRAEGMGIIGSEPAPAVMLHKANVREEVTTPLIMSAGIAVASALTIFMVLMVAQLPLWYAAVALVVLFIVLALGLASRGFVPPYREQWQEEIDQRNEWAEHNEPLGDLATSLVDITDLPPVEDWEQEHPGEPYEPFIHVVRAVYPGGASAADYFGKEDMFAGKLRAAQLVFSPMEERDAEGQPISGTAGHDGMCVWYTTDDKRYEMADIFEDNLAPYEKDFIIRNHVLRALRDIRGIGECLLVGFTILTKPARRRRNPDATRNLLEIKVRPMDTNVGINNFRNGAALESLKNSLQVEYVRAKSQEGKIISVLIGDDPSFADQIEFKRPGMATLRAIRNADFAHVFHVNGIYSTFGTPKMVDYAEINSVEEQEFVFPQGMKYEDILAQKDVLMENTGNSFMEIRRGRSDALAARRSNNAGGDEQNANSMFSITSAKVNPLNQLFSFGDYQDQVIKGRTPGKERLIWSPGVMSNEQLAWDSFDGAEPHLLIAGSSGSGKMQALTTPVLTGSGWTTMGEVKVGDVVYDMAGNPTKVIHAYETVKPTRAYRVTFSTGETIEACSEHLWTLTAGSERRRAARASASATNGKLMAQAKGYQDKADEWDALRVSPAEFPHANVGSAWFMDNSGTWREATSWLDYGKMAEANPHISSRIAQSAIRGVPAELWGLLVGSLAGSGRESRSWKVPTSNAERAVELFSGHGYNTTRDKVSNGVTTYLRAPGLAPFISKAWEEENDRAGFARDVIDVTGFTPELLYGLRLAARSDEDSYLWNEPGALDAVKDVLGAYGVPYSLRAEAVAASRTDVDKVCAGATLGAYKGTEAYFQGLFDACGMKLVDGGREVYYLTVSDPSVRYHLLERGMLSNQERTGMGVERIRVYDRRVGAFDGFDRELSDLERIEYVRGLAASHGRVVDGQVVITLSSDTIDRVRERSAGVPTVKIERGEQWFELSVECGYVNAASSDFIDIAQTIRGHRRYDVQGRVVMSIPELESEFGLTRPAIEKFVDGLLPTAAWRAPIIQRFATGIRAKASGEVDLYPVAEVYRRAIDVMEGRKLDSVEGMVTITTAELADSFVLSQGGSNYSVPVNPVLFDGLGVDELPVHPYVLGCYLGDGFTATGELCGIDSQIFDTIESFGYGSRRKSFANRHPDYRVVKFTRPDGAKLLDELVDLGVANRKGGTSAKHIPDMYKYASFDARLELIRGLMDTDGYRNSEITLSLRNRLAEDTLEVLRSLGVKVTAGVRKAKRPEHSDYLRMSFTTDLMLHRLQRKVDSAVVAQRDTLGRAYVTGVEEIPAYEIPLMRCITVDSPTSTYRVGKTLIPTHNSVVVQNMICQMICNNSPEDLRMWMVEPKIGLQRFRDYDTVERFVDSWSPTEDFFQNVADWAHDLVEEMLRRNRLMAHYVDPITKVIPEKLSQARDIAREEGVVRPDGTRHELMIPYMLCYIEECATVFAESANKEQRDLQTQILTDIARIARESRSAGIYLICLTQYPTNASIPSVIRNQMRRLGLACKNSLASRVCIERDGLEKLTIKGTGMVMDKNGDFVMYRGLFLRDGNPRRGEANDIMDVLKDIPTIEDGDGTGGGSGAAQDPYIQIGDFDVDDIVGMQWESVNGMWLDQAIEDERDTKDYTEDDHKARLKKAGIRETVPL